MLIVLIATVDYIRLGPRAPAGMVTAVGDDLGAELVAKGQAAELTLAEFQERLCHDETKGETLSDLYHR